MKETEKLINKFWKPYDLAFRRMKEVSVLNFAQAKFINHLYGNDNLDNHGYRNGGSVYPTDPMSLELKKLGFLKIHPKRDGHTFVTIELNSKGRRAAETLFWIMNGQKKARHLNKKIKELNNYIGKNL